MVKEKRLRPDSLIFWILVTLIIAIISIGYNVNYYISSYAHILNYVDNETSLTLQITSDVKSSFIYYKDGNMEQYKKVKKDVFGPSGRIETYFKTMDYLEHGNDELGLPKVTGKNILVAINEANLQMIEFIDYVELISASPNSFSSEDLKNLDEITLETYKSIDNVINEFEHTYLIYTYIQKAVFIACLVLVIGTTLFLLLLGKKVIHVENIAKHDFLTGLNNIGYLKSLTSPFENDSYALIFIDVNNFKEINDTFGHRTGDDILKALGRRLKTLFKDDIPFRYGGDEFVIFIMKENSHLLDQYINAIRRDVFSPITDHNGTIHKIIGSIGALGSEVRKPNIHQAINQTDALMYIAKSKGFDTSVIAHTDVELKELLGEDKK